MYRPRKITLIIFSFLLIWLSNSFCSSFTPSTRLNVILDDNQQLKAQNNGDFDLSDDVLSDLGQNSQNNSNDIILSKLTLDINLDTHSTLYTSESHYPKKSYYPLLERPPKI